MLLVLMCYAPLLYSIYLFGFDAERWRSPVPIGRASRPFPRSKPDRRLAPHPAFQSRRCTMTRPCPFLTEPQWHQGQSPRLCPLWLQGQCRLSFSFSWPTCTIANAFYVGLGLLRCLRPPAHTLAFSRPRARPGERGVPQFQSLRRLEIPVAACCRPGAWDQRREGAAPSRPRTVPLWVRGRSPLPLCACTVGHHRCLASA